MSAITSRVQNGTDRLSRRKAARLQQALARRRIQELRDEKLLQGWLTEVWDEPPSPSQVDSGMNLH